MADRLAALLISLAVLLCLFSLALPRSIIDPQTRTIYIKFDGIGTDESVGSIDRVSQTLLFGVQPPFVPVGEVEAQRVVRETEVVLPIINLTLGSWLRDERRVRVRLIDGENRESALRYWHFPAESKPAGKLPFVEDVEQRVRDMDLPGGMDESFSQRMDNLSGIGDSIDPVRRDEMISLMVEALRGSDVAWTSEMLASGNARTTTRRGTGFGGVIVYLLLSVLVAGIAGVLTWVRLKNARR